MITVHHLENSRSTRIVWLLEELGVPYQITKHLRDPDTGRATDTLKAVHPLGKSPIIEDNGQIIVESGAIFEYLLNRHDRIGLRPPIQNDDYLRYSFWMNYVEGSVMPHLYMGLVFKRLGTTRVPFFARSILKKVVNKAFEAIVDVEMLKNLNYIESELGRSQWSCGTYFSAADIMLGVTLKGIEERFGYIGDDMPNIKSFINAMIERPAYQQAMEKIGQTTAQLSNGVIDVEAKGLDLGDLEENPKN